MKQFYQKECYFTKQISVLKKNCCVDSIIVERKGVAVLETITKSYMNDKALYCDAMHT